MTQTLRHFLVDDGYKSGKEFCAALLRTGEFSLPTLRKYGATATDKENAAAAVAEKLAAGRINSDELFLDFCMTPRQWLYLAEPQQEFSDPDPQNSPASFFLQFGDTKAWYGPVSSDDGRTWMAYSTAIKHLVETSEMGGETTYAKARIRWQVIAEIGDDYIALHWNNFNRVDDEDALGRSEQFEYWIYIPAIVAGLEKLIGSSLAEPALNKLVLHQLMNRYDSNSAYSWQHLRVRAEAEGIALNARSGGARVAEIDISGIRGLTKAMAEAAARALGRSTDEAAVAKIERALLRTLVHEWGTLSYEFCLEPISGAASANHSFRGHVYFGAKPDGKGPDQLAHCKCFKNYGGSSAALRFLREHLKEST
jgi:hypothetical protein